MVRDGLVSVVVPVYNCAEFLPECIESIVRQTCRNLEIILVDDGSSDGSGAVCDEYAAQDARIRVIHQRNAGQVAATWAGITVSSGEYVQFVDADDWIEADSCEFLLDAIGDADLVTSGIFRHGADGGIAERWRDRLEEGLYSSKKEMEFVFKNLIVAGDYDGGTVIGGIMNNKVSKLYRSSIVKTIARQANVRLRIEEDFLFNVLYVLHCVSVRITHRCLYHYRYNPSSVCHTASPHYLSDRELLYETLRDAMHGHPYEKTLLAQWQRRFLHTVVSGMTKRKGFSEDVAFPVHFPPFAERLWQKRVVLFGKGAVGRSYAAWFRALRICEVVLWVDNAPSGEVLPPSAVQTTRFDAIVVAIRREDDARLVRKQLLGLGVAHNKILWELPRNTLHLLGF